MKSNTKHFLIALLSLSAIACAGVKDIGDEFDGIQSLFEDGNTNISIIQIHGMGIHKPMNKDKKNGADEKFRNTLVKDLGFDLTSGTGFVEQNIEIPTHKEIEVGKLISTTFTSDDDRTLTYYEIYWDEITRFIQASILGLPIGLFDEKILQKLKHYDEAALVNRLVKLFVDTALSDAIIYSGTLRGSLQDLVLNGLKLVAEREDAGPIVIISDSLGSALTFSSLKTLDNSNGDRALREFAGTVKQVYMNANQLPLLLMGDVTLDDFKQLEIVRNKTRIRERKAICSSEKAPERIFSRNAPSRQYVAFTDVNDALSYTLDSVILSDYLCLPQNSKWVNVIVKNGTTIPWIFTWPPTAHTSGFKKNNKEGIRLMVNGADKTHKKYVAPSL